MILAFFRSIVINMDNHVTETTRYVLKKYQRRNEWRNF